MPAVARGGTIDSVATNHLCDTTTTTEGMSTDVFVNGTGVHRDTDKNTSHTFPPTDTCPSHQTAIDSPSETVFANGLGVARVGDTYGGGEEVSSGSEDVFSG